MRRLAACLIAAAACGGPTATLPALSLPPLPADGGVREAPDAGTALPPDAGDTAPAASGVVPAGPSLSGCPMFPSDDAWNRDVSGETVDPQSSQYLAFMGAERLRLYPGFGGEYGQPVRVVPQAQARVPMSFRYASQSEPGPYPFPSDMPVSGDEDRHATVLVQGECRLYETYNTWPAASGFSADSGAVFDLISGARRPDGWTSATASGLPILPGLVRYDEAVEQGEIRHALGFVAGATAHAYASPATHSSGTSDDPSAPPLGLRVRLRADFDLSRFKGASLVVLRALQKYGMFLHDNAGGQAWYLDGALDQRWSVPDLDQLKTVPASAFEAVRLGAVHSGQ